MPDDPNDPANYPPDQLIELIAPLEAGLTAITQAITQAGLCRSKWLSIAVGDLEHAIKQLSPVWSGAKHHRLRDQKYWTAADWLKAQGRTVYQNEAGSLTTRTVRWLQKHHIDGDGNPVVELLRGKRIVRYLPGWALEEVDRFAWSAKTDAIASAQSELAYLEGPLKPPPPPKSKRQRTNKTTSATAPEGTNPE